MASNPNDIRSELAEAYRKFEAADKAGDRESAQQFHDYASQLEQAMRSQRPALEQAQPDQAQPTQPALASANEDDNKYAGMPDWAHGGGKAFVVGAARRVSNYLSNKERNHQMRGKVTDLIKSKMPQEWLPTFDKIHDKSDFEALDSLARARFGKDYEKILSGLDPETSSLVEDARKQGGISFYDNIIRPYFSKDGPDLAQDWERKVEKLRQEYTPEERESVDKPWLAENAKFFEPGSWFDNTTKAPWHDFNGFFLSTMENAENIAESIVVARGGGSIGARIGAKLAGGERAALAHTGKAIERGAKTGGVVAGTISEGLMIRDQVAQQTYDQTMGIDDATWKTSEDYQRLRDQGMSDTEAKQIVSTQISTKAGNVAMVVSGAMGAPSSAFFGSLGSGLASRSFVKNVTKGALYEAAPEGVQEVTEQIIGNLGARRVDPHQDVFEGTGESFVGAFATSAPIGAFGGMTESRHSKTTKEQQEALESSKPWERAANARWKLQNQMSNQDDAKMPAGERLAQIAHLEDLQQKEAEAFLRAEPSLRNYLIKTKAPDDALKRLDILKASANTMIAQVERARKQRTDAQAEVKNARKMMAEREEIVSAVQNDVLKRDDMKRMISNMETIRSKGALDQKGYDELEKADYGKYSDDKSRFFLTQKGVRALSELKKQLEITEARISGVYAGDERRSDLDLRQRIESMSPAQRESAIYRDPLTNTLNRRAFEEAEANDRRNPPPPPGGVAQIDPDKVKQPEMADSDSQKRKAYAEVDVDSLKWVNDNMSTEAGDKLIQRVAEVLNEQDGVTAYRVGGDEFVVTGDNPEAVEQAMRQATIELDDSRVITHGNDAVMPKMTWAVGGSRAEASEKMKKAKAERERSGKRSERGKKPPSYRDVTQGLLFHFEDRQRFGDLPKDMQDTINDLIKKHGTGEVLTADDRLPLTRMPVDYFPVVKATTDRSVSDEVALEDLPPVVVAKKKGYAGYWYIDGRHRLEAARKRGVKSILAIDVGSRIPNGVPGWGELTPRAATMAKEGKPTFTEMAENPVTTSNEFPADRVIIPKELHSATSWDGLRFVMNHNGQVAIPNHIAADIYRALIGKINDPGNKTVAEYANKIVPDALRKSQIQAMLETERETTLPKTFNAILAGVNLLSGNPNATAVVEAKPSGDLERQKNAPRILMHYTGGSEPTSGLNDDGTIMFHEKDGGYPREDDRNPGMMPKHQLIMPKALFDQMPDFVDWISFKLDRKGNLAMPAQEAADVYEFLMRENGLDSDSAVASITHTLAGGPKLHVNTITKMRDTRSYQATVSVRAFNSMLQGINMLANNLDATSIKGNPAYGVYPTRPLDKFQRKYEVQGNLWDGDYDMTRDDYGGFPLPTRGDSGTLYEQWRGSRNSDYGYGFGSRSGSGYSGGYSGGYVNWKPTYVVSDSFVDLLKTKKTISIWCNADDFAKKHKLPGFATGMFVSEMSEARIMNVTGATQAEVDQSNDLFAYVANKHIDLDGDALYEAVMSDYARLGGENVVVKYNLKEMEEARAIASANPAPPENAGTKTLVIHPADKTTDFLKPIYDGHPDWTIVTGDKHLGEIKELIEQHDRIIMMGHGSPSGLMAVGQFENAPSPTVAAAVEANIPVAGPKKEEVAVYPRASETTMDTAKRVVSDIVGNLGGRAVQIELHASAEEIPAGLASSILAESAGALHGTMGFLDPDTNTIHIIVGNIAKQWPSGYPGNLLERAIAETVFHELVGHYGLRGLIGDQELLDNITAEIREAFPDDERLRVNQMAMQKNMTPEDVRKNPALMSVVGEEIFAHRAGLILSQRYVGMSRKQNTAFERAIDKMRSWLVKHGFGSWIKMNERDLVALVARAEGFLRSGKPWQFRTKTGLTQMPEMRDANIFQSGLRRIIEFGVQPNPQYKDKNFRKRMEAEGKTIPEEIPLFGEKGSIRGYIEAFRKAIATKQLTQLELDESNIVETLLPNPVAWAMEEIGQSQEQFAKNTGIPLDTLKKLATPGAQIDPASAEKIANYLKTPEIIKPGDAATKLGTSFGAKMSDVHQRDLNRPQNEIIEISNQELEAEWRALNAGRLSPEAFTRGSAMTYKDLQNLLGSLRESSSEPDYSDIEVFAEFMPAAEKAKVDDFFSRLEAARKARRKRPDKEELDAIMQSTVDPSKITLSRDLMRRIVENSALSEILVWPVRANDDLMQQAYKSVTGNDPTGVNIQSILAGNPELSKDVHEEMARIKDDGFDAGFDADLNQWLPSPLHTAAGREYTGFVPFGQSSGYQIYLFWEKRKKKAGWQSGHFSGVVPEKHRNQLAPGGGHISHLRFGVADDADPKAPQAPNPLMTGKALAAIEYQSDAFQRATGGFRDTAEKAEAQRERDELMTANKIALRQFIGSIGIEIAAQIRAKAEAMFDPAANRIDRHDFETVLRDEFYRHASTAWSAGEQEVSRLNQIRMSPLDARAAERANMRPAANFASVFLDALDNGIDEAVDVVGAGAKGAENAEKEFIHRFMSTFSDFLYYTDSPDQASTYTLHRPDLLHKVMDPVLAHFGDGLIDKALAAAGNIQKHLFTVPKELLKDPEFMRIVDTQGLTSRTMALTRYAMGSSTMSSSPHNGMATARATSSNDVEISYNGNDPDGFKNTFTESLSEILQDWSNDDFYRRSQRAQSGETLEYTPTVEEFLNWLGARDVTNDNQISSRYGEGIVGQKFFAGKLPVEWDEDGMPTKVYSAIITQTDRRFRLFFGYDSQGSITSGALSGVPLKASITHGTGSISIADPIPEFAAAVKTFMQKNRLAIDPDRVPWRVSANTTVAPATKMKPIAEAIMAGATAANESRQIDAAEASRKIRQLTVRLGSGIMPDSLMGKNDRWKIAQLRFLISHAVRNGIPKIQWATGDASTIRGGHWTPSWVPYENITWSVEPMVFNGAAKDHIVIRASGSGGAQTYAVTLDNLPSLIGSDAATYIQEQLTGKKPAVKQGDTKPSRADLSVFTMGDKRFITRRGSNRIIATIDTSEDLDTKLNELVEKAVQSPNGWAFADAETGTTTAPTAQPGMLLPEVSGQLEEKGQQWGEVSSVDIGGPIQILNNVIGADWITGTYERKQLLGSRNAYDAILPRLFGKEIKKYGGILKKGAMKLDRRLAQQALTEQGMHRAPGIVPTTVEAAIGTPEVRSLTGDSPGFVVVGKDGLLDNAVFPTEQAARRAMNKIVEARDTDPTIPISVWEFEITPKMIEVFSKPVSPFMYNPHADPLIKEAFSKIGGNQRSFNERFRQWRSLWKDSFIQGALDRFHGIERALDEAGLAELEAAQNGYVQARLSTSLDSMMKSVMLYGHPVWREGIMRTEGEGLKDILSEVSDKLDLWTLYMAGVRAKRLKAENREKLFSNEQIERMVHLGEVYPAFKRTAERYAAFHKKVLDFAQEAGTINPETRPLWENADYIPFYRVADDRLVGPMSNAAGIANISSPIKQLKGGTDNVGDLMHNIMVNLTKLIDGAVKNHAALTTVDALRPSGIVSTQPMAWSEELIPMDQVRKALIERGVNPDTIPDEALTGFQKMFAMQAPKGNGIISVMRNGKKEFYYTDDVLLYRAMTAINKQAFGRWMNLLRAPKRLLTSWITLDPGFMVANYLRDSLSAFVLSRDHFVPLASGVVGFGKALVESEEMRIMSSAGAAFESGYINQYDPEATKRLMQRTLKNHKPGDIILDSPQKLFELWKRIGSATENANRIAVYRAAIAAGKSKAQAAYESKDLMDFSMSGDWPVIQFLVQTVPFLGARMQGLYRLGRGMSENPLAFTLKGTLIGLAGMALYLMFKDDERYKELEDWDKDTYFHFWIGNNHYRLPKPFEVGAIFNTIPERVFGYINSHENDAGKKLLSRFGWILSDNFNMNPIPQAAQPMVESWFNYSFFTRTHIEQPHEQERLPPERYRATTSPTMVEIARMLPDKLDTVSDKIRSPLQLQNLWAGYTGTLGRYFLMGSDALVRDMNDWPEPPAKTVGDYPVIGRFVRGDTPRRTRYEEEFYNTLRRAIQVQRSVKFLDEASEDERRDYIEGKYDPYIAVSKELENARQQVSKLNKDLYEISMDRDMPPEQKRREIDQLQLEKNQIFKDAYELRPGGRDNQPVSQEMMRFFVENFNGQEPPPEIAKSAPMTVELLGDVTKLEANQRNALAKAGGG